MDASSLPNLDEWYSYVEDEDLRKDAIQYFRHSLHTKGFDISLKPPSSRLVADAIIPKRLDDPAQRDEIKFAANYAVATYNSKMGKPLLLVEIVKANVAWRYGRFYLTLRAVDERTLELKTYQTRVYLYYQFNLLNKDEDEVETFMPLPDTQFCNRFGI
ncbi:hypothetical protein Tsubulata_008309 [Turnera subulata]|uniref:Cystatin domain-containing protein n=1 Tax=Turnera subulata TaxID=218843 RepID=A0A9Q0JFW8_9ROSI|nr:hypothetical protein Tsubulata_008309 [Turnera subulata]